MKVVLLQNVPKLGKKHAVVNASDGFAYNHLFPKRLAIPATKVATEKAQKLAGKEMVRKEEILERATELKEKLHGKNIKVQEKVTEKGTLYGSIGEKEIVELIQKEFNIELDKSAIKLDEHLKELGDHEIKIKLSDEIEAIITLSIEAKINSWRVLQ